MIVDSAPTQTETKPKSGWLNSVKGISKSKLALSLSTTVLLSLFASGPIHADVQEVPESELTMTKDLSFDIHKTLYYLHYLHYSPKNLDNDYSAKIFDRYLKVLDPNKLYFTREDIEGFEKYREKIDDF